MDEIIATTSKDFILLSGDDGLTLPAMALGAKGVISVVSNIVPKLASDLTRAALAGDFGRARALHYELMPLVRLCFWESNPIPVKAALAFMGKIEMKYRLPLVPPSVATQEKIRTLLKEKKLMS